MTGSNDDDRDDAPQPHGELTRIGRLATVRRKVRRKAVVAGALYLAAVVFFHAAVVAGVVVARLQGREPHAPAAIDIEHLRQVDDRVWASAQPRPNQYRELAAAGVDVIIDLRTGAADDRNEVDQADLARLGISYVRLPVRDGHVPGDAAVLRLFDMIERNRGIALVHCGAGVGRSSTLAAGYMSYQDRDVSLWDTLALGPVTLEQAWYLTSGERNEVVRRLSEALDAPRRVWSRLRSLL